MWIWIICLLLMIILLVFSIIRLWLFRWDVRKMANQLEEIIKEFGTNERIRTNSRDKELNIFALKVNYLISLYKKEQQMEQRTTKELKQEITNISHDLRTPMTSIKGFSSLLEDESLSKQERNEYLEIIQSKIASLTETVDLFYEISKIDSADHSLLIEEFPMQEIVIPTLLTFYPDFESRNLQVLIDERGMDTKITGDKKALERIVINIVQNALRYGDSFFEIRSRLEENYFILQAKNDSFRLDSSNIQRVFERSYTLDSSRENGQTGLGLYIVRKLAEKQKGKAEVVLENNIFVLEIYIPRK